MGNTSSHEGESATPTPGQPSSTAQAQPGPGSAIPASSAQPIPTPTSNPTISSAPLAGGFHSGLTPPARSPSPPPPSTPPLLPYGGHLSAQNPHALALPQAMDYSKTIVTRLVMEARLAPFYRGLEDYEEGFTEEDISRILDEVREQDYEGNVQNSVVEQTKLERDGPSKVGQQVVKKIGLHKARETRQAGEREEAFRREKKAYVGALECPICFLVRTPLCLLPRTELITLSRAIPRISTPPDVANNPSAPNVSSRSNDLNHPLPTSNLNRPLAHFASKQISG